MTPVREIISGFAQYTNTKGRASRSEFCWFFGFCYVLFLFGVFAPLLFYKEMLSQYDEMTLWYAAIACFMFLYIPRLAITFRRLHDINLPGGIYLVVAIPFIGWLGLLLLLSLKKGTGGANRYGANPIEQKIDDAERQTSVC